MGKPDVNGKRLEAFSDGVIAVIITIMVLELKPPHGSSVADLLSILPKLLIYILSFVNIAVYWNNHHHLFLSAKKIDARVMWVNMLLLFFLSLIPFATAWIGEHAFASWPAAIYGVIALLAGLAYYNLTIAILKAGQLPAESFSDSDKIKGYISQVLYFFGTVLAFVNPVISYVLYMLVCIMWFIPDYQLGK